MHDRAVIHIQSGNGGRGSASFRRVASNPRGGPDGGPGGAGGDVLLVAKSGIKDLSLYKRKMHFFAENGASGSSSRSTGRKGKDLILEVPIGTEVYDADSSTMLHDFLEENIPIKLLNGGSGGAGNASAKSSTNQAPRTAFAGKEGEARKILLNFKLRSHICIVGLPNVGKTSLLCAISNAKADIGDHYFSTIQPSIASVYFRFKQYLIMDTPGLIRGASLGKGLGARFLKHVQRANVLVHLIDATSEDAVKEYQTVIQELEGYDKHLLNKPSLICLTKTDLVNESDLNLKKGSLRKFSTYRIASLDQAKVTTMEAVIKRAIMLVEMTTKETASSS